MTATKITHVMDEFRGSFAWLVPISILTTALIRHLSIPVQKSYRASRGQREDEEKYGCERPSDDRGFEDHPEKFREGPSPARMPDEGEKIGIYDSDSDDESSGVMGLEHARPPTPPPLTTTPSQNSSPPVEHTSSKSSGFMNLPTEIRISILSYCAPLPSARRFGPHSLETFLTLLRVSKTIQHETYIACLPLLPLALWSKKGVQSFLRLLKKHEDLGCFVRYLWIGVSGKLDEEELGWAVEVVGRLCQLKSIACGEFLLMECARNGLLAKTCERVTLMSIERGGVEYQALGVKKVRLCTGVWSTKDKFPNVELVCFNARRMNGGGVVKDERVKLEYEAVDRWIEHLRKGFVLVERDSRRISERGLEVRFRAMGRKEKPDMWSVVLPARWTDWDIWSADVVGEGVWDVCGL